MDFFFVLEILYSFGVIWSQKKKCFWDQPNFIVSAYCWQAGQNPSFTGRPTVQQVDLRTVRVTWEGIIEYEKCVDNYSVKYWQKSDPQGYQMTELISLLLKSTICFKWSRARRRAVCWALIIQNLIKLSLRHQNTSQSATQSDAFLKLDKTLPKPARLFWSARLLGTSE